MNYRKKIAVIADDFTGAAEIGGIGLRHGLKVAIETDPIDNKDIDLLVIATDCRSMSGEKASEIIEQITRKLLAFHPDFIYKKIDSALRGNVTEELVSQMKTMGRKKAVIIAANPIFNRIIKNGEYFINNIPLNETLFSTDSFFPIQSNNVLEIVSPVKNFSLLSLKPNDTIPEQTLAFGDVENLEDLRKWTLNLNDDTLYAGASGFFNSLLLSILQTKPGKKQPIIPFGKNAILVLGSLYAKDQFLLDKMTSQGIYHSNMPKEIYKNKNFNSSVIDYWVDDILNGINKYGKVVISSIHKNSNEEGLSFRIKEVTAVAVKKVFIKATINELLIEGGSTTSEILDQLGIKKLTPIQELETGVIRMKVDRFPGLFLTTKPGSYFWPENLWLKNDNKPIINNLTTHE